MFPALWSLMQALMEVEETDGEMGDGTEKKNKRKITQLMPILYSPAAGSTAGTSI